MDITQNYCTKILVYWKQQIMHAQFLRFTDAEIHNSASANLRSRQLQRHAHQIAENKQWSLQLLMITPFNSKLIENFNACSVYCVLMLRFNLCDDIVCFS